MLVFTRYVFTISQILRTRFKIDTEKQKKRNLARIVSQKDKSTNSTIHISICLFCFSMCISNLVLKSLEIVNTSLINTNIFFLKKLDTKSFNFKK
jgi:hypothetical protein